MPRVIFTAQGLRYTGLIEGRAACNGDGRSAVQRGRVDSRIETEIRNVLAVVLIVERLVEDSNSGQRLVREVIGDRVVMDRGEVLRDVRSNLVVVEDVRSDRRELATGADEGSYRECLAWRERPVDLTDHVIAVSGLRTTIEEISCGCGTCFLISGGPERQNAQRKRVDGNPVLLQKSRTGANVGCGRFGR